MEVTGLKVVSD